MTVRKAVESDIDALIGQYEALYEVLRDLGLPFSLNTGELGGMLAAMIKSRLCLVAVCEEGGAVRGFISAGISRIDRKLRYGSEALVGVVNDIYVEPELRGGGAAAELLSFAEDWFRENGVSLVECSVVVRNGPSAAFFGKNGYRELSRLMYKAL